MVEKTIGIKTTIRGLGYYQAIGGIIGMLFSIPALINTSVFTPFPIISLCLFSYSIYCGVQLISGHLQRGLLHSKVNHFFQLLSFSGGGVSIGYVSGFAMHIGVGIFTSNSSSEFKGGLSFSISKFYFINVDPGLFSFGVNVVGLVLLVLIIKLQRTFAR